MLEDKKIDAMSVEEMIDVVMPLSYQEREDMYYDMHAACSSQEAITRLNQAYNGIIEAEIIEAYTLFIESGQILKYDHIDSDNLIALQRSILTQANHVGGRLPLIKIIVLEQLRLYIKKQQIWEEYENAVKENDKRLAR